jgi:hypothetical protein
VALEILARPQVVGFTHLKLDTGFLHDDNSSNHLPEPNSKDSCEDR